MPEKTLGEVLHEARKAAGAARPRPWPVEDWADRGPELQQTDEAMAAAVAKAERERIRDLVAERFKTVLVQPDNGYPVDAVPWSALAGLLTSGLKARSEEGADPETPLSDALHTLGEVQRMAESMAMSGDWTERQCGRRILAAIGPQGDEEPAERSDEKGAGRG